MPHTPRIGVQIDHTDPFWVQVREAIWQQGGSRSVEVVEVAIQEPRLLSLDEQVEVVEDLVVQELDALICNSYPQELLARILERGIAIVYVAEITLRHRRFVSRRGLAEAGRELGAFLDQRLAPGAQILVVGGEGDGEDTGQSRLDGFLAGLSAERLGEVHILRCQWSFESAQERLAGFLAARPGLAIGAIYGLSDSLALAAYEACHGRGRLPPGTPVLGINGDPLALAAISAGRMTATIESDVDDMATQALDLALRAAKGLALPTLFQCRQRLITAENVADAATRKLISLASLPSRLIDVNRRNDQQRRIQIETGVAIDRKVGMLLDEQQLSSALTSLIRDSYGFDDARYLSLDAESGRLAMPRDAAASNEPSGPLAYALAHNQLVFIPDTGASHRFAPDPQWPETHARVVVPVRLGGQLVGLLDLHRRQVTHHTREELASLQLLADRLAISMRNAQLYSQEQEARSLAEQADRLKTTLLANVSHELRTPLNVILGYSRGAIDALGRGEPATPQLTDDLRQIYASGEHLLRLINDLLDLSRAEIGELDLLPEQIDARSFLDEVFRSSAASFGAGGAVAWRLTLPPTLPTLEADPVRLRQILLNLLHNAHKFTERGTISLGAEQCGPELHLWVADTGIGIAPELREQIFDPFVSSNPEARRNEGIGLGLNITRRLVALHRGRLTVESEPGRGSTFHVYLPLPAPEHALAGAGPSRRALLLISEAATPPEPIAQLAARRELAIQSLRPGDDLASALQRLEPALIVWDMASTMEDGWQAVEQIRGRPELRQLPVIIYGGGETPNEAPSEAPGTRTGLLLKPLGDETLLEALGDLDPRQAGGSILIVEDDPHVRAQHRRLIAQHFPGYSVRDVGDGREALAAVAVEAPSLVLLDLRLPELDGFAVLEALRAERRTAGVPVLVLSGKPLSGEDIRRLSETRAVVQTKGMLSSEELAEALRRSLDHDERLPPHTSALVKQAIAFIQHQHGEPLSRQAIADAVGVHKDYLGRIFQQELGLSPWEYLTRFRVLRAKELLRASDLSVAEVATRVGFETPTYFSQVFHREVGCSPRAFRARPG